MFRQTYPTDAIVVEVFGCTDVGRTREHNEDAFVVSDLQEEGVLAFDGVSRTRAGTRGMLFMVADGMGGAAAGELASAMAIETVVAELHDRWVSTESSDERTFAKVLRAATESANTRIYRFASENSEHRGMGTTATIAGLLGDSLFLSQVGDSRAYLVRAGVIRQITKDQSLMQRLMDEGEITAEEAEQSERRNIILQALGPEPFIRSDITHQRIRRGDILVLCSDGLTGQVRESDIVHALHEDDSIDTASRRLVDLANARGGPDNITIVVARFTGDGLLPPAADDAMGYSAFQTVSGENEAVQHDFAEPLSDLGHSSADFMAPVVAGGAKSGKPGASDDDLARSLVYGILIAVAIGVALIIYRKFFVD